MTNKKKLKKIDEQIINTYKNNVILDGIVNFDIFSKVTPKILWILKESNITTDVYKDKGWWRLTDYLDEDIKEYHDWKRTWGLVLEISDAIIHNAKTWEDEVPLLERLEKEGTIRQIAVININKTSGGSSSDQAVINTLYQKNKESIMEQIEAIAPDIIINGSRVEALFDDLKISKSQRVFQFDVATFKNGIIINAYHPNQHNFSHERYFELVRDCIKAVS
jgi:hypothetical protein